MAIGLSATGPVMADAPVASPRAPFAMFFAPATGPAAPAFDPVAIPLPRSDWHPRELAVVSSAAPLPADTTPRTIFVRPATPETDPAHASGALEPASGTPEIAPGVSSPSPLDLADRLFTWLGGLFAPGNEEHTVVAVSADVTSETASTPEPVAADRSTAGWGAKTYPASRSGGRPDDDDIPADIQFDLVGWLAPKASPDDAIETVTVTTVRESRSSAPSIPAPVADAVVEAAVRSAPEPPPVRDPGIIIARMTDDPYGGAPDPGTPDTAIAVDATVAEAAIVPAPVNPAPPTPVAAEPDPPASPVEKLAAVEPRDDGAAEPLVIYIRGTVAIDSMYFGEEDRLGRKLTHVDPSRACAERNRGGTHICPEPTVWPVALAALFGATGDGFPESIVRYDDRSASQYRAAFPAANYERLVTGMSERLGEPTKVTETLAPVLGMARQTNRIARWVSSERTEHGKAILEIRSIDDVLWNLPPDIAHGVIRLYFEGADPIYAAVSKADLRLVKIRSMVAPGEEPL